MPYRNTLFRTVPYWPVDQWSDVQIVPGAFVFAGASDPTLNTWQPTGAGATFRVYVFATADEVFFTFQLPKSYKEGTDLHAHVHWTPRNRGVAEDGNTVAWMLDYSISCCDEPYPASSTVDMTDTCDGVNEAHQVSPHTAIPGMGMHVSALLIGRLYRDAGDTWVGAIAAQLPALLEIDLHVLLDTLGSLREGEKV